MKRLFLLAALAGCNQTNINTPIRVFDRPSDVALSCRQVVQQPNSDPNNFIFDAHPIDHCTPEYIGDHTPKDPVTGATLYTPLANYFEGPVLAALVAQSARGELALVDVSVERVVDLQRPVPGFNFVPVGKLPEHVRVSADGCVAATANVDSCDLAVVDLPTLYNMQFLPFRSPAPSPGFADNVVRRLTPTVGGVPLGARPSWIELAPYTEPALRGWEAGGTPGQCLPRGAGPSPSPTPYRAWVALPGCSLVVELDLSGSGGNAEVLRALRFTPTTVEVVSDLSTLSCPAECDGEPAVDVDGGAADGGARLPTTQAQPATIALDVESGLARLFVGDRTGERLTILPFDAQSGALGTPRQLALDPGALGVQVVRISPRSEAGKFLYAVARDSTVRVIDLDREVECETNPDPRALQAIPSPDPYVGVRRLGCFPLGDPATPKRAPLVTSPGITLPGLALPKDVAFIHTDAPPPVASNLAPPAAGPATLVGDYAWIISSDGRATVVNIFDACPAPNIPVVQNGSYSPACSLVAADPSRAFTYVNNFGHPLPMMLDRVSHRLRSGSSRFFQPANFSDNVGQPRLSDSANPVQIAINGVPKSAGANGVAADLPGLVSEPFPPVVSPSPLPALPAMDDARYVAFYDPDRVRNETWTAAWEGLVPGTHRTLGAVLFRVQNFPAPILMDNGGAWCSHGVLAGDKVFFTGCDTDNDCGYLDYCVRDPAAPSDVPAGMCLRRDMASKLQDTCKNLLRAPRRYRVLSARQGTEIDTGVEPSGRSDVLMLGEIYEPEHPVETRECALDSDCAGVHVLDAKQTALLGTSCLTDSDGVKRCLRACNPAPNASEAEQACGHDFQCLTSRFGDGRCLLAPLDENLFQTCMPELQTYEVHAGDAFLVNGSATGVFSDLQANPATRECEIPPQSSEFVRLHQARIPVAPPAQCPPSLAADPLAPLPGDFLDPVSGVATNVCQLMPDVLPQPAEAVDRTIHYENPMFGIVLKVKAGPLSKSISLPPSPAPDNVPADQLTLAFSLVGSGFPLGVSLAIDVQAQQPRYAAVAPDRQTVFIVDEGKQSVGVGLRGQLLKLSSQAVAIDRSFQVR